LKLSGVPDLSFANIGADLDVAKAHFIDGLDLNGTEVNRSLILSEGNSNSIWDRKATLNLKDVTVNFLRDRTVAWPDNLQLDGFSYKKWRVADSGDQREDFGRRNLRWFLSWLSKEATYSPEPYRELATVFRDAGMQDSATAVLYEGKQRERENSTAFTWALLTLSWILIGYGYYYQVSVCWCVGFVVLGMLVLIFSREGKMLRKRDVHFGFYGFFYSLDAFLPFVKLRNKFGEVDFRTWIRYYFYIHRLAGFVIGFFILAGLSGITK
jgi:hypothetical protein